MKTVQIGQMPGKIESYAIEAGTTFADALALANLNAEGFEVKADSVTIGDLGSVVGGEVNVILLTKKVKGNAGTVQIGQMPGKIETYALEEGTTFAQALELANLNPDGFEVKADSVTIANLDEAVSSTTSVILLTKKVKGNAGTVQIGQMPGKIETYALEEGATFAEALELANLSAEGFEVKVDSAVVSNLEAVVPSTANVILLTKRVKGNK